MGYFKDLFGKLFGEKIERDDWVTIDSRYFKEGEKDRFTEGVVYRVSRVRETPEGKTQVYVVDNSGSTSPIGKHLVHKVKEKK